jgi:hypothetical protein
MSTPDEVAKLREIKRLLDRIQQLPHIAAMAAQNGARNGYLAGSHNAPEEDAGDDAPNGYYPDSSYAPASIANGAHIGYFTDASDVAYRVPRNGTHNGHYAEPHGGVYNGHYEPYNGHYPEPPPPPAIEPDPAEPPPIPAPSLSSLNLREERMTGSSRALVPVQSTGSMGISPWVFVTATAVNTIIAAVLAVVITLGVGRRDPGEISATAMQAKEDSGGTAKAKQLAAPVLVRPIQLKAIGSRSEPLRLEAKKPSRFPLELRPDEAMQGSYILVLTGLPQNTTLSGATRMSSDTWHVAPGALRELEIIVPEWSASVIELKVELRHANGAVAAQGKAWLSVPPPVLPQGAKLDQAAIRELLQKGDRLLGRGDVASARAVYEKAAALGSAQGALVLGSTYDPGRLWSLGVFGMVGNKDRARHWYQHADQLGHPEAKGRIKALRD